MRINLHILIDELAGWGPQGALLGNHLRVTLSHALLASSLPAVMEDGALYIIAAEALPPCPPRPCPPLAIAGVPPEAWRTGHRDVLWFEAASVQELVNEAARLFWKYACWDERLRAFVDDREPLEALGAIAQPLFRNPIGAVGTTFRYLFGSYPEVESENVHFAHDREAFASDGAFINVVDASSIIADEGYHQSLVAEGPFRYVSKSYECTMLTCNVCVGGAVVAQVVTNDFLAPLTHRDEVLVAHLARVLERRMTRENLSELLQPPHVRDTLGKLLSHVLVPETRIGELLATYAWEMDDAYVVLELVAREQVHQTGILEPITLALARKTLNDCYLIDVSHATFIFNLTRMRMTIEELVSILSEDLRPAPVDAFMSMEFDDFRNVYYFQQQACEVGSVGLRADPTKTLHCFEDYALDCLLQRCVHGTVIETVIPSGLRSLVEHDRTAGTHYVRLLRTYLDNDRNVAETSRLLFIHRNTFAYRFRQIEELSHLDLDDPDLRLRLSLALRLLERKGIA